MPDFAEPLLPHWRHVTPFALVDNQPHPKDPPALTDAAYTVAFKEVKQLGAADSKARTREQTEIAHFWADGAGTCTPPGHWNQIAQTVARQRGNTLAQNARLFAMLNLALADAGILCWDCKYKLAFWRPVTGIRNADDKSRQSMMPRFGADGLLTGAQIAAVTDYVLSLSGKAKATPEGGSHKNRE